MSYLLNTKDLSLYGLYPSHAPDSNISLEGCFSMPVRIGDTHYVWAEEDYVQPFVDSDELFFAGRDITLYANMFGSKVDINSNLRVLYDDIKAFTDLVTLSTPYGDFSVYVQNIDVELIGRVTKAAKIVIRFREPVVTLAGTLPATGTSLFTIDSIPLSSFGLYVSSDSLNSFPSLQEQFFTKYGSEHYQVCRRGESAVLINGFVTASSVENFKTNVSNLYKLFSSSGERSLKVIHPVTIKCFAKNGFNISNVFVFDNLVIGNFNIELTKSSSTDEGFYYLVTEDSEYVLTEGTDKILI